MINLYAFAFEFNWDIGTSCLFGERNDEDEEVICLYLFPMSY